MVNQVPIKGVGIFVEGMVRNRRTPYDGIGLCPSGSVRNDPNG